MASTPLSQSRVESLLRYSLRMLDELCDIGSGTLSGRMSSVVGELGRRTGVRHVSLFLVHRKHTSASLLSEWSDDSVPTICGQVPNFPLSYLGSEAMGALSSGTIVFTELGDGASACSKLIAGLLRELGVEGIELIPVRVRNQLRAIVGLAHSFGPEYLDANSGSLIQQLSKTLVVALLAERRERRRRRNHQQWKRLIQGACDFAIQLNQQLEIVQITPFRKAAVPDFRGLFFEDILSVSSRDSVMRVIREALQSSTPRTTELRAVDMGNRHRWFSVRIEPTSVSKRGALTLYLTDNEADRIHAAELQNLRDELNRAARLSLLGHLAAELAHQQKQPLQVITTKLFTLKSRISKGDSPAASLLTLISQIEEKIEIAGEIINDVRDYVQGRRIKTRNVPLKAIIDDAISMVQPLLEKFCGRISVRDSHGLLQGTDAISVFVERVQTTYAIVNLLVNAIEACTDSGARSPEIVISFRSENRPRMVVVEVCDNGPGLPPGRADNIFERFFTTKADGFGIGLAICRNVIERQGGKISAHNNPEHGCTFCFTLPVAGDKTDESAPPADRTILPH